ncbi:FliI/YscN family ATPase [Thermomicrobium sp. CFH 73360]|uniref:FliI/YscN family ATPase n=1 Tax=Thermomicrobium sp. CFH 73360 TaxID=2951987 RepID=UPI0020775CD5|nr:FliI/YscN family ATPase [Thermomicrobium sp. CFH 73360]MCM8746456.1 FliI/YscN family ATPase [Thermomicrobium sp. CFH 73360]
MSPEALLERFRQRVRTVQPIRREGRVVRGIGLTVEAIGLDLEIGDLCHIFPTFAEEGRLAAEVVGFHDERLVLVPLAELRGVRHGSRVVPAPEALHIPVGPELLGRVVDGLGRPIDGKGPLRSRRRVRLGGAPPSPLQRMPIQEILPTGVRAIDAALTCGRGQRLGIFAGSGVGKSTLLGMISRKAVCDVRVIALIGERGREVQEFIERDLGPEGLQRAVVVVSTSDQPALLRIKAAWTATLLAEYFRDRGASVVLMMDSVTRLAMAQREVGLAAGEPPATRGYPPSVFALLPRLLERAGNSERGSITAFYTVLVEGDDLNEPIADTVRGILDGHIVLSRALADRGHFPAIDILASVSRLMPNLVSERHRALAAEVRELLAAYESARDLVDIGAYVSGTNPAVDRALALLPELRRFLQQRPEECTTFEETLAWLEKLLTGKPMDSIRSVDMQVA